MADADGGDDGVERPFKKRLTRGILTAVVVAAVWGGGFAAYGFFMDRSSEDDEGCIDSSFRVPRAFRPTNPPVELGGDVPSLEIVMGQRRGVARDEVHVDAPALLEQVQLVNPEGERRRNRLEVHASSLDSLEGDTIPRGDVHGRVKVLGQSLVIDVCIDAREVDGLSPGAYEGTLIITDPRVTPVSLPVSATVQARYLWLLSPLVLLLPGIGLLLVWQSVTSSQHEASFGRGALVTFITAMGATASVFGAQGVNNPAWGGADAFFALIATMYVTATGATATLGGAGGAVARDNPKKV
ncbi:MAG TPA: hypothetical protein VHI71_04265 [Actinomycetota bacterium]|nr:hypothetical protein [Actinomycetota bacterium]